MILHIHQFRYAADNLGYLVHGPRSAMTVDGGATEAIMDLIDRRRLCLRLVAATHNHADHIVGQQALLGRTGAALLDPAKVRQPMAVVLDGVPIRVLPTPGHTLDGVTFRLPGALLTGDTLFNGTVGNCFSGDLDRFFASLSTLLRFAPETRIYAGHDYVAASMDEARRLEPDNAAAIDDYLRRYRKDHVCSRLGDEVLVNPFLRSDAPAIVARVRRAGLPVATARQRWKGMMTVC